MNKIILISLLLCLTCTCFAADNFTGSWFNASYTVKLSVSGQSVSGSFTRTEDNVSGTIQGKLVDSGKGVQLSFKWDSAEGAAEFGALLYPAGKGKLLSGQRWDSSEVLTSFSLRKAGTISPADLPDEDTDFEAVTPPTNTATPTKPNNPVKPATPTVQKPLDAEPQVIFDNNNLYAVGNGAKTPTQFTITQSWLVTSITNYHWNNGAGAKPGAIAITGPDGKKYGPWNAAGLPGMGNRPNCSWEVKPNIVLMPGKYTVTDSSAATWSQNSTSNGAGITKILGVPIYISVDEPLSITPVDNVDEPLSITPRDPDIYSDPLIIDAPEESQKMDLVVCENVENDQPVNPTTHFRGAKKVFCWTRYNDMPDNTTLTCIWVRNGKAVTQSEQIVSGSGWMWFSLSTTSQNGLGKGKYAVKIRNGETVIGYKDFVVE